MEISSSKTANKAVKSTAPPSSSGPLALAFQRSPGSKDGGGSGSNRTHTAKGVAGMNNGSSGANGGPVVGELQHSNCGGGGGTGGLTNEDDSRAQLLALPPLKRARNTRSKVWNYILILNNDDERRLDPCRPTHICCFCDEVMKLSWTKNASKRSKTIRSYSSTQAKHHLQQCDKGGKEALEVEGISAKDELRVKHENQKLLLKVESAHQFLAEKEEKKRKIVESNHSSKKRKVQLKLPGTLSYSDRAICAQAHWFMYSPTSPSFDVFQDPFFHDMLLAMVPTGSNVPKIPILTIRQSSRESSRIGADGRLHGVKSTRMLTARRNCLLLVDCTHLII